MNIEIETDEDQRRPRSIVPPVDYTSRAVKLRLMMLFGMLILVIFLMKEAANPEHWKWMGFDEETVSTNTPLKKPVSALSTARGAGIQPVASPEVQPNSDSSDSSVSRVQFDTLSASVSLEDDGAEFPAAAQRFWQSLFPRMNSEQQQRLFQLVRNLRLGNKLLEEDVPAYQKLVGVITGHRTKHHREMLNQLALLADGNEEKTVLANELYESQELWEKKIQPAFLAALEGEDFSISQLQQLSRLQRVLDPLVLGIVQDHSSIGWIGDSPAWIRLWERVANKDYREVIPATHLQLTSQPQRYRGQAVKIEGWVRSARRAELEDSKIGISGYHEMWMRPKDTKLSPYCVYALNLPDDFPKLTDQFADMNVRVVVTGLFFKVRTYVDSEKEVRESPVVLANSFQVIPDYVPASVNNWQPSRATLIGLLVLIPIVATAISWFAYRTTETRRYELGAKTKKKIGESLDQLTTDPNVQTDREKIMQLYDPSEKVADEHGI